MARRGRKKKYDDPIVKPGRERVRQIAASITQIDGEIAELRKDRSEYLKSAKEVQIKTDVLTSCIKLAKMDGGARQFWLDCFDQMRIDLGLDAYASELQPQQDLEDVIAKADAKPNGNGAAKKGAKAPNGKLGKGDAKGAIAAAQQHLGTDDQPTAGLN